MSFHTQYQSKDTKSPQRVQTPDVPKKPQETPKAQYMSKQDFYKILNSVFRYRSTLGMRTSTQKIPVLSNIDEMKEIEKET